MDRAPGGPRGRDHEGEATEPLAPRDGQLAGGVFAVALAIGLLFARARPDSYDADIMLQVARSIAGHHSVRVTHDVFGINTPYSFYGLGMSLMMLALYAPAKALGADPTSAAMDANAVLFALTAAGIYLLCRLLRATRAQAVVTAGVVALATPLLAYVATGFSEVGVAAGVTLGLLGLAALGSDRGWGGVCVGAGIGVAVLFRTDSLVLVAPFLAVGAWLFRPRRRTLTGVLAGGLPFAAVWAVYNTVRFGAPWRLGYAGQLRFNHPFLSGLYGLVLSPGKGVIWYAPVVAVAVLGARASWRRFPVIVAAAGAILVSRVVFFAPYWAWHGSGSWGPRMLVPAMPVLALGVLGVVSGPAVKRWALGGLVAGIVAVSALVQVVGASVDPVQASLYLALGQHPSELFGYGKEFTRLETSRRTEKLVDSFMFDWRYFPVTNELGQMVNGRHLVSKTFRPRLRRARLTVLVALALAGVGVALSTLLRPWGPVRHQAVRYSKE